MQLKMLGYMLLISMFIMQFACPTPVPLQITTSSLPIARTGVPYSAQLQAIGGVPPYKWTYTGTLPPGLDIAQDGTIAGTTGDCAGVCSYTFTVTVTDNSGQFVKMKVERN